MNGVEINKIKKMYVCEKFYVKYMTNKSISHNFTYFVFQINNSN